MRHVARLQNKVNLTKSMVDKRSDHVAATINRQFEDQLLNLKLFRDKLIQKNSEARNQCYTNINMVFDNANQNTNYSERESINEAISSVTTNYIEYRNTASDILDSLAISLVQQL